MAGSTISFDPDHNKIWPTLLQILTPIFHDIIELSRVRAPEEAVAIVSVHGDVYPLINQARSSTRFEVSETQVVEAMERMANNDSRPLCFFHSHPTKSATPSADDCAAMRAIPNALSLIHGQKTIPGADTNITVDHLAAYYAKDDNPDNAIVFVGEAYVEPMRRR